MAQIYATRAGVKGKFRYRAATRLYGVAAMLAVVSFGCTEGAVNAVHNDSVPQRIVSLDYCADQFVLRFADPASILAVSPDAGKSFSYMRDAAQGVPTVRPRLEEVLVLQPDLVVRSYGGGPGASAALERVGIEVLEVGWANDLDAVMATTARMAEALGAAEEGARVVADLQDRLDRIEVDGRKALYLTPGGVTTGPGSLMHELVMAAGLQNFETSPGWRPIPLERLAYTQPDLIAGSFFDTHSARADIWSAIRHPVAQAEITSDRAVQIDGALTACGGWFLIDAVEALAAGAEGGAR